MFTGLVDGTAIIRKSITNESNRMARLHIENALNYDFKVGDSIAVNGCCLTASLASSKDELVFDVSRETLDKTNLGALISGGRVNLEQAMRLSDRLDGHLVSGHIDTTCVVTRFDADPSGWLLQVKIEKKFAKLVIPKGSICLNGVSLTVNNLIDQREATEIEFMLIPTTLDKTNLKGVSVGAILNIEFDLVGKYILRANELG